MHQIHRNKAEASAHRQSPYGSKRQIACGLLREAQNVVFARRARSARLIVAPGRHGHRRRVWPTCALAAMPATRGNGDSLPRSAWRAPAPSSGHVGTMRSSASAISPRGIAAMSCAWRRSALASRRDQARDVRGRRHDSTYRAGNPRARTRRAAAAAL